MSRKGNDLSCIFGCMLYYTPSNIKDLLASRNEIPQLANCLFAITWLSIKQHSSWMASINEVTSTGLQTYCPDCSVTGLYVLASPQNAILLEMGNTRKWDWSTCNSWGSVTLLEIKAKEISTRLQLIIDSQLTTVCLLRKENTRILQYMQIFTCWFVGYFVEWKNKYLSKVWNITCNKETHK